MEETWGKWMEVEVGVFEIRLEHCERTVCEKLGLLTCSHP